jgi:peptide/nickel transport system ATP-binding protein
MTAPGVGLGRPLVEVEDLRVRFGPDGPWVVKGISFAVHRGECLALVGESGSGKSVTSRALVGLAGIRSEVRAQRLRFDGEDLFGFSERTWRRIRGTRIGFVMQDALGSLDPLHSVGQEIAEPLRLHTKLDRREREAKVLELLKSVHMPEPELRAAQYPFQLSGGLRQRALIASAIACGPELLVADEPTTSLDASVQAQVLALLESLRTPERAMIVISHDLAIVARLADRVAVMLDGAIVEQGPTEAVFRDPQHAYTKMLLAAAGAVHERAQRRPRRPAPSLGAPLVLQATGLTKIFKGPNRTKRTAVSAASFGLRRGETIGIVGESGSGKTTLARLILGLTKPDEGLLRLREKTWGDLSAREQREERRRIQVVFQDPLGSFDPRYTVERVLGEAIGVSGHYARREQRRTRAIELLELVRLDESYLERRPIELSGGQRQRVAIARALAAEPEVLVCDEPVSALDVSVQAQILDLLADLKERLHLSCIFISHDLGIVHRVSDRVLVMKDGVIVETGDVAQVFARPQHPYTRLLLSAIPRFEAERQAVSA